MTQCANCNCDQGRRECPNEPPEMPFAGFLDALVDVAFEACGWILAAILVAAAVSIVMGWTR